MIKFRKLTADEVEVRVGAVGSKYVTLLLYKNARVDMQILDETVGPENWQREHHECKGNLFCRVGIKSQYKTCLYPGKDDELHEEWVWKSDCGSESYTEKEKGEASDSFKRACVNWGIGRELYTAPTIFVPLEEAKAKDGKCYTRFQVTEIGYDDDGKINALTIARLGFNGNIEATVYSFGNTEAIKDLAKPSNTTAPKTERTNAPPTEYRRAK